MKDLPQERRRPLKRSKLKKRLESLFRKCSDLSRADVRIYLVVEQKDEIEEFNAAEKDEIFAKYEEFKRKGRVRDITKPMAAQTPQEPTPKKSSTIPSIFQKSGPRFRKSNMTRAWLLPNGMPRELPPATRTRRIKEDGQGEESSSESSLPAISDIEREDLTSEDGEYNPNFSIWKS